MSADWAFPITDDDAAWMRRYPGLVEGPVFESRACWICGKPGYTVPAPPEPITAADYDAPLGVPLLRTGDTCPGHEYATRRALHEHPEWTSLTSSAKGWR